MKKHLPIFIILLINILLLWVYFLFPSNKLSLQINDFYYKFNQNLPNQNIVFVQIGEKSINKFGRWPWNRDVLAKQIDKIKNAKMILLDMVFSEPTNKDNYLAQIISQKNIICGFFLRNKASETIDNERFEILSDSSIELDNVKLIYAKYSEINVEPILSSCSLNGVFSTFSDIDNLYRRYVIAYIYKGLIFPTLGIQALRVYYNEDIDIKNHTLLIKNKKIPLDKENSLKLNFYKIDNYNILPITDVENYNFNNKIVIIGISEIGVSDIRSTPIGQIPGPLLHYTFISNILNEDYIREYKSLNILFILIAILLPFLIKKISTIAKRVILYLLFFISFFIIVITLYKLYNIEIDIFYTLVFFTINLLLSEYQLFKQQEQQEKFIKEAFQSYLSPSLLIELIHHPEKLKLGGEEKEITILFSDMRNFTSISETLSPEELIQLINNLFSKLSHIIIDNKGMIDKYIGDAIMALFNAPIDVKDHATLACKTAIQMQLALEKFNQENKTPNKIQMGIGINTDKVYVGNMGSDIKFNYSALGDGVNVTSRLESETKKIGVKILISKNTYEKIDKNVFKCTYKGKVFVKGKKHPIDIYSLEGYNEYMI